MADYDLIAFVLVNQLLDMNDADEEDWAELLKYNVLAIFPLEDWALLPMRGQLALASTIVGAKSLANYDIAFRIMCAWEEVGGCYWVAQLELMRHAVMHSIRSHLSGPDQVEFDATKLKDRILTLLPLEPAKYVTHHILRLKLALLRADLLWLLDSMSASANPYDEFVQYYDRYKLHCFVPWFLSWSLNLLKGTEDCFPPLGQGATAMLQGQAQKFTGKARMQESKMCCEEEEEEEEISDISVSHIDIEECYNGEEGQEKGNSAMFEGRGVTPEDTIRRRPKRKFGDLSLAAGNSINVSNMEEDKVNMKPRTRGVEGRTLFATPPPVDNYLYTSAPSTVLTGNNQTCLQGTIAETESVYEGVDYCDTMQVEDIVETESNKENHSIAGQNINKAPVVITTPTRLPCQDLRIVTDATELHYLTQRAAALSHATTTNLTTTGTNPPSRANTNVNIAINNNAVRFTIDNGTDNYSHFTNGTQPHATTLHYSTTPHTTCSTPNSTHSNTDNNNHSQSNSTTSDDTYVTSMTVDEPNSTNTGVLNHLVHSVWKMFTPASQGNNNTDTHYPTHTITTTNTNSNYIITATHSSLSARKRSDKFDVVASSASLEYSVTTAHTIV